jgi:hypothetical protein
MELNRSLAQREDGSAEGPGESDRHYAGGQRQPSELPGLHVQ